MAVQSGTFPCAAAPKFAVAYDFHLPAPACTPPPLFLLVHGFAGEKAHLAGHAAALARSGCAALNVNMSSLMAPSPAAAQERNIAQAVGHVQWALAQRGGGGAPLVDAQRVFLAGHSAGGSVALEAAVALGAAGVAVRGLCLLDGVPWPRTEQVVARSLFAPATAAAAAAAPLHLLSLRSVPGAWNLKGKMRGALDAAWAGGGAAASRQSYTDVFIVNSGHADPINPPQRGFIVSLLGLLGPPRCAAAYAELLLAFAAAGGDPRAPPLAECLQRLASEGVVTLQS